MMTVKEAKDIVENSEIINPGTEHAFVKGCFGNRYRDAVTVLASDARKQRCSAELARTQILTVAGFECKVFYNYVAPYNYGMMPTNCWSGIATLRHNNTGFCWSYPLDREIATLEEACSIIGPAFACAIKRLKNKEIEKIEAGEPLC